jgi:hypothetical protein
MDTGKSKMSFWSRILLEMHRSLSKGGLFPFVIYIIVALLICGIFVLSSLSIPLCGLGTASDFSPTHRFSAAYYHLFTSGGQNMLGTKFGWLVTTVGLILVAIMTSLFTNLLDKIAKRYLEGETHYVFKDHIVIFGYHEMLPGLVKQLMESEYSHRYFLVQTSRVERARAELSSILTPKQMRRVIIQKGEITSLIDIDWMHVNNAFEIFILGEEMKLGADSSHDVHVLQCLRNIVTCLDKPSSEEKKKLCHVMFEHHSTFSVFQHIDLNDAAFEKLALFPFNYYEMWARKVFVNTSLVPDITKNSSYLPLEGTTGIGPDSQEHVHLVVVGMSRMGIAMRLQAAHLGQFPNFISKPACKTRITFIDHNARREMYHLQGRMEAMFMTSNWRYAEPENADYGYYTKSIDSIRWNHPLDDVTSLSPYKSENRHLGKDFIDLEWEFIQGDVENPVIQAYIRSAAMNPDTRLTVAICVPDSNQSIAIALNLPSSVYKSAVQVLVYQKTGDAIASALSQGVVSGYSPYNKLKAFGMSDKCYDLNLVKTLLDLAGGLKKQDCVTFQETPLADAHYQLLTPSESKSAAANMWSNIYNACHVWTKLRSVGSKDGYIPGELVPLLGKTEHIRWNAEQLLTQFRPLTEKEQNEVLEGRLNKDDLKREKLAHLDICSRERLEIVDSDAVPFDEELVNSIRTIYLKVKGDE